MTSTIQLRPLNDIINTVKERFAQRMVEYAKSLKEEAEERIRRIEQNRQVLPELADVVDLQLSRYDDGDLISVNLGIRPETKRGRHEFAQKLIALRQIVGSLRVTSKDVCNAKKKLIEVYLESKDYPGIRVRFQTKLPKGANCRIETRKQRAYSYHSLVCEVH